MNSLTGRNLWWAGMCIYFIDYAADGLLRFNGKQPIPEYGDKELGGFTYKSKHVFCIT